MGDALEAGVERVLDHLRRPVPGRGDLLTDDAGNTVSEIDPLFLRGEGAAGVGCAVGGCLLGVGVDEPVDEFVEVAGLGEVAGAEFVG
jgi:hypothetical protein